MFSINDGRSLEDDNITNLLFVSLLLMSFLYKLLNKHKINNVLFNFLIFYVNLLFISSFEINAKLNKPLENCTKKEFFTVETIKETNNVNELFLKSSYYMLAITKIRPKNHFCFSKFCYYSQVIFIQILDHNLLS